MKLINYQQFIEEIKTAAAKKRLTGTDLAKAIDMKPSTFYYNYNGKGFFSLHHCILLAKALDLHLHLE